MFRHTPSAVLPVIAVLGVLLFWSWRQSEPVTLSAIAQHSAAPDSAEFNGPLRIKGFSYTIGGDYGIESLLKAELLEVRPRRFMAFNVKSVNEVILRDVNFALHTYELMDPILDEGDYGIDFEDVFGTEPVLDDKSGALLAIPFLADSANNENQRRVLGRITRLVADKITIVLFRDELKFMVLNAENGLVDAKRRRVEFYNGTLLDVQSSRIIRARRIQWDKDRKAFLIVGEFTDTSVPGRIIDKPIAIDLDFAITPYECTDNC